MRRAPAHADLPGVPVCGARAEGGRERGERGVRLARASLRAEPAQGSRAARLDPLPRSAPRDWTGALILVEVEARCSPFIVQIRLHYYSTCNREL